MFILSPCTIDEIISTESKVTYRQIQNYVFEKYGFKI